MTQAVRSFETGSSTLQPMPYWLAGSSENSGPIPETVVTSSASHAGHVLDALVAVANLKGNKLIFVNFGRDDLDRADSLRVSVARPKSQVKRTIKVIFKGRGKFLTD